MTKVDGIPVIDGDVPIPVDMTEVTDYRQGVSAAGGYVVKWIELKAGQMCMQHVHPHAHATFVYRGLVEVRVDGVAIAQCAAGGLLEIPAGKNHAIVALTDAAWACIHYLPGEV